MAVFLEPFRPQQGVDQITEDEERDGAAENEIEHGKPLETVAGEDVKDGHREGGDSDGDHEEVEHGIAYGWADDFAETTAVKKALHPYKSERELAAASYEIHKDRQRAGP
jgi:hypothetical protein